MSPALRALVAAAAISEILGGIYLAYRLLTKRRQPRD